MGTGKNANNVDSFVITRIVNAPRELVFKLWSEPEHIKHWLAPKGFTTTYKQADIRKGGISHYSMKTPDGLTMWGKAIYREIQRPSRIEYVQHFSNEAGEVATHPMSPTWPKHMLTTVNFEDLGDKTKITLSWTPLDASAEELTTFDKARDGMSMGWGGTFENLDTYIEDVKRNVL